jgi:hypothetical protein
LLAIFESEASQEVNNRNLALRLGGVSAGSNEESGKNLIPAFEKLKLDSEFRVSDQTAREEPSNSKEGVEKCVSCSESANHKSVCGHYYCNSCIKELCLQALKDISLFPVRCCKKNFQQELIEQSLGSVDWGRYKELQLSISSNIKNIDPEYKSMVITNGWKLCPGCGAGIEKTMDCNHMTCLICKFQFCYICGADWIPRKCKCDLWNQQELQVMTQ